MSKAKHQEPSPPSAPPTLEEKVEDIHQRLVRDRSSELFGVLDILGNRRKLMWINFTAGMARGVGFFLGVSLIGALILGGLALAFNAAAGYLGFKDLTLEQAVRAAVLKFSEVQEIVTKTQEEVQAEHALHPELNQPAPEPPR